MHTLGNKDSQTDIPQPISCITTYLQYVAEYATFVTFIHDMDFHYQSLKKYPFMFISYNECFYIQNVFGIELHKLMQKFDLYFQYICS